MARVIPNDDIGHIDLDDIYVQKNDQYHCAIVTGYMNNKDGLGNSVIEFINFTVEPERLSMEHSTRTMPVHTFEKCYREIMKKDLIKYKLLYNVVICDGKQKWTMQ